MFEETINGDSRLIRKLNKEKLPTIYKQCPYYLSYLGNKKIHLWEYVKIHKDEEKDGRLLEVRFLKFIDWNQRYFAFSVLSSMMTEYEMQLVGFSVNFSVHINQQDKYGEVYTAKWILGNPTNVWNFSPHKEYAKISIPYKEYSDLMLIHEGKLPEETAEKFHLKIPTLDVNSLIFI